MEERIIRVTAEAKRDMKLLLSGPQKVIRRHEVMRAREASMILDNKLKVTINHSIYSIIACNKRMSDIIVTTI